ncbi:Hypothetical predicted protein [Lecanosticta acicola]|uniref:Uncharacterized protein n=1 Tax=Lecanosticta acicola TaxID=111012 RepID=A0AAI9EBG4_9PEZI|nr:Hypothetical predicted protein [Lecanosticta acicola]
MDISHIMSVNALLSHAEASDASDDQQTIDRPPYSHVASFPKADYQHAAEAFDNKHITEAKKLFSEMTIPYATSYNAPNGRQMVPIMHYNGDNNSFVRMSEPPGYPEDQPQAYTYTNAANFSHPPGTTSVTQGRGHQRSHTLEAAFHQQSQSPKQASPNPHPSAKAPALPPSIRANDQSEVRMSEVPSLSDSQVSEAKPSKGRSFGDNSCRAVKAMRASAEAGDIQAAIRLGWSVERITKLFNEEKVARGEQVYEGEPIDDPEIITQIQERQKKNRDHQRERAEKLRIRAQEGDFEAAKKAGYGKKRLKEMFPEMKEHTKEPAFDFQRDEIMFKQEPLSEKVNSILSHDLGLHPYPTGLEENAQKTFVSMEHPSFQPNAPANGFGRPRYPTPGSGYGVHLQLRAEYEEARRAAYILQGRLIEASHAASIAKQRVLHLQNQLFPAPNGSHEQRSASHKRKISEMPGSRKLRYKNRATNFPLPGDDEAGRDTGRGSTVDEAIEVDD